MQLNDAQLSLQLFRTMEQREERERDGLLFIPEKNTDLVRGR